MAGKAIQIIAGGIGVAAAAPFTAGSYTIITTAAPPVITAGRLAQLADAGLSIVAPGVNGPGGNNLVLGPGANDAASGARSVIIGRNVTANNNGATQADDQILIGNGIAPNALTGQQGLIAIGNTISFTGFGGSGNGYGDTVLIGHNVTITGNDASNDVGIGASLTMRGGSNVAVGVNINIGTNAGGQSVAIGHSVTCAVTQGTAVGDTASVGTGGGSSYGWNARANGAFAVGIGFAARADDDSSIAIGRDANSSGFTGAVCIGRGTVVFENNAYALGGDPANGTEMRVLRLGPNTLTGYPGLSVFLPSAGAGVNIAAPNTTFRGGISTGNSVTGGRITFQSSTQGAGGAAYQVVADRFRIAPGGVAGIPTIEFVNQISTPGAAAGTLTNAPAVGNPTIWAEVLYNGVLRKIPMW